MELEAAADTNLAAVEREYEIAVRKRREEEKKRKSGTMDEEFKRLDVEWRAYAERASVKATGAELSFDRAVQAAVQAEQAHSAAVQARREADLMLRRAVELVAVAEELHVSSEGRVFMLY